MYVCIYIYIYILCYYAFRDPKVEQTSLSPRLPSP